MTHAEQAVHALLNALATDPNLDPTFKKTLAADPRDEEIAGLRSKLYSIRVTCRDLLAALADEDDESIRSAAADLAPLVGFRDDSFDRKDI